MGFKDILVHLDAHRSAATRLQLALSIARMSKAHLAALYGFELPELPPAPFSDVVGEVYVESAGLPAAYERERDAAFGNAEQFEAAFHAETKRAGLTGDWRIGPDKAADLVTMVTERARYADLAVLGQVDPEHPRFDTLARLPETVMMECGRPA